MSAQRFSQREKVSVRSYAHINLVTVSYLFDGAIMHRDSSGNELAIESGDTNLVAVKGIETRMR